MGRQLVGRNVGFRTEMTRNRPLEFGESRVETRSHRSRQLTLIITTGDVPQQLSKFLPLSTSLSDCDSRVSGNPFTIDDNVHGN